MKYNIVEEENKIILRNIKHFDPKHIFECGQAFRWNVEEDNSYTTIAYGKVLNVKKHKDDVILSNTNIEDFNNIWYNYFDLGRDYDLVIEELSKDPILAEAIEFGEGIRILNQEPFEMIISFITSANNQIPRIKKSIELMSQNYGEKISEGYYSFPTPERLAQVESEELRELCKVGFRDIRIKMTSRRIAKGEFDINKAFELSKDEGKELLMTLSGVGPKVSDCILLFAYNKADAFPVDVWVKRVMEHFYLKEETNVKLIGSYGAKLFGSLAGFAQQYLFYYARELGIGK
ncbi:DNA glycosylase [Tissierella sp.]|uniref:DNA-3-methyladenine glycosylase family protein n=1 Tax=Tissierella sp. TaxID=41274 RepID=UPI0028634180|nr:DNA glycosylase [Tissierella sp.]MDR7856847.1 DNA glycosylase [Tissierella sp.]